MGCGASSLLHGIKCQPSETVVVRSSSVNPPHAGVEHTQVDAQPAIDATSSETTAERDAHLDTSSIATPTPPTPPVLLTRLPSNHIIGRKRPSGSNGMSASAETPMPRQMSAGPLHSRQASTGIHTPAWRSISEDPNAAAPRSPSGSSMPGNVGTLTGWQLLAQQVCYCGGGGGLRGDGGGAIGCALPGMLHTHAALTLMYTSTTHLAHIHRHNPTSTIIIPTHAHHHTTLHQPTQVLADLEADQQDTHNPLDGALDHDDDDSYDDGHDITTSTVEDATTSTSNSDFTAVTATDPSVRPATARSGYVWEVWEVCHCSGGRDVYMHVCMCVLMCVYACVCMCICVKMDNKTHLHTPHCVSPTLILHTHSPTHTLTLTHSHRDADDFAAAYELIDVLGQGAFGRAIKARRLCDGQFFCVKVMQLNIMTPKDRKEVCERVCCACFIGCVCCVVRCCERFFGVCLC